METTFVQLSQVTPDSLLFSEAAEPLGFEGQVGTPCCADAV